MKPIIEWNGRKFDNEIITQNVRFRMLYTHLIHFHSNYICIYTCNIVYIYSIKECLEEHLGFLPGEYELEKEIKFLQDIPMSQVIEVWTTFYTLSNTQCIIIYITIYINYSSYLYLLSMILLDFTVIIFTIIIILLIMMTALHNLHIDCVFIVARASTNLE